MGEKMRAASAAVLRYVLWIAATVGGFFIMLRLRTTILIASYGLSGGDPGTNMIRVVDKFSMLIIGIALIICVVLIEYFLSRSSGVAHMVSRFLTVVGIELLSLALMDVVVLGSIGIENRTAIGAFLFTVELGLGDDA